VLGRSYGSLVCLRRERSKKFTGGANGERRRVARAREGVRQGGFITPGLVEGVSRSVVAYSGDDMGAGRWRRAAEPAANGERRFARQRVRTGCVAPA
jgi:hypothetical protein